MADSDGGIAKSVRYVVREQNGPEKNLRLRRGFYSNLKVAQRSPPQLPTRFVFTNRGKTIEVFKNDTI